MNSVVRTDQLGKSFGNYVAVEDLSLSVQPGEVYGFLGPNGAGKTTTIRLLLGLTRASAGRAELFGEPAERRSFGSRQRIGVVGEQQVFYDDLSAREYLSFFGRLYRVESMDRRIAELLSRFGLTAAADTRPREFSRGMQQKLGFVRALLHEPHLLILDEPVSALDPKAVVEIRQILQDEVSLGRTIFVSSHLLTEVEQLAHRVGIMHKGRLVAEDTVTGLKTKLQPNARVEVELEDVPRGLDASLLSLPPVERVESRGRHLTLHLSSGEPTARADVSRAITGQGGVILQMVSADLTLEEAFVAITEQSMTNLVEEREA